MSSTTQRGEPRARGLRSKFVVEERFVEPAERHRFYRTGATLMAVGLAAFLILLIGVLTHTGFERLDAPVEHWFDARRSGDATGSMALSCMILGAVILIDTRRTVRVAGERIEGAYSQPQVDGT